MGSHSIVTGSYAQADVSASNLPGNQQWSLEGFHYTKLDGTSRTYDTWKTQSY